jgi:hypothetical protein
MREICIAKQVRHSIPRYESGCHFDMSLYPVIGFYPWKDIIVLLDIDTGNNKRILLMKEMLVDLIQEYMYCTTLLAPHAFMHCNTTTAFKTNGTSIQVLQKVPSRSGKSYWGIVSRI